MDMERPEFAKMQDFKIEMHTQGVNNPNSL